MSTTGTGIWWKIEAVSVFLARQSKFPMASMDCSPIIILIIFLICVFAIDPRVKDWPMMSSPFPTLALCIFYAYFSKVLAPKLMANRKAFDLRNLLVAYNLFQTVFSAWIFYEVSIIWILSRCVLSVFCLFAVCYVSLYVVRLSCVSVSIWLPSYTTIIIVTIHFSFLHFFAFVRHIDKC